MNCTTCTSRGREYPASEKNAAGMCDYCFNDKPHPIEVAEKRQRLLKLAETFTKRKAVVASIPKRLRRKQSRAKHVRGDTNLLAMAGPYLAVASQGACILCARPKKKFSTYCKAHAEFMDMIRNAKSKILLYKINRSKLTELRRGISMLQRNGITPEDLKYV